MNKICIKLSALAIALSGCGTPLPVEDKLGSTKVVPFDLATFDSIKNEFNKYYLIYSDAAVSKREYAQNSGEITFYSAIVSVVAGAYGSVKAAIGAGGIGAGAGLYSGRYNFIVQATNYETAADSMMCMYLASQDMTSAGLALLEPPLLESPLNIQARDIAKEGFLAVRSKLYRNQSNVVLTQPDMGKLASALQAASAPAPTTGSKYAANSNTITTLVTTAGLPEENAKTAEATNDKIRAAIAIKAAADNATTEWPNYKKEIDKCVSKISG